MVLDSTALRSRQVRNKETKAQKRDLPMTMSLGTELDTLLPDTRVHPYLWLLMTRAREDTGWLWVGHLHHLRIKSSHSPNF